ncbi:hypothetical protein [Vibrio gallaecicus]|uniref:hypothetical protein n=1 Tax=Vibrio gallaecicus TaxID=552386 RepID=UPI0010C93E58|nr:hypothetical protein [Vibrio gallaecicus]MDN3617322.1 hypothetical protein [Vibrio gallaecicus]
MPRRRNLTKHLRRIPNARHLWFALNLVFTAQYFKLRGLRCSPLNAALCLLEEIHVNSKTF